MHYRLIQSIKLPGIIIIVHIAHKLHINAHILGLIAKTLQPKIKDFNRQIFVLCRKVLHVRRGDEDVVLNPTVFTRQAEHLSRCFYSFN